MSHELIFCSSDDSPALSIDQLRDKLTAAIGQSPDAQYEDRLTFAQLGIDILLFDQDGRPALTVTKYASNTDIKHLNAICATFRDLGWEV
jgi:hypothetical protein